MCQSRISYCKKYKRLKMSKIVKIIIFPWIFLFFLNAGAGAQETGRMWEFEKLLATVKTNFYNKTRNSNVLVDPGYRIWGMAVIKWSDGKYHGYYARWPEHLGHNAWLTDCEIAHAVADKPEGPFEFVNVVLKSRNSDGWDVINSHNPAICIADGRICLYYISNDLKGKFDNMNILSDEERKEHWNTFRNSQRIGVAISKHPEGPFNRADKPVVEPDDKLFKNIAVNPAVTYVDGKFVMIIKGDEVGRNGWYRIQLVGHSFKPEGPFKFQDKPVYDKVETEDAGIWYDNQNEKFYMTCHVMGQLDLALFSSPDGYDWKIHDNLFSKKEIKLNDGTIWKPDRMERPFILTDENGRPTCLYVAISDKGVNGNIAIPIKNNNRQSWFSQALEYKGIAIQDNDWHIWGCSPIQDDEGRTHLFVARWPQKTGHMGWKTHSQIAHYRANHPEGPFEFVDVVLEGTGKETWDKYAPHNPAIHKVKDKYALFYIANNGLEEHPANQKIGLLISESLYGPWKKVGKDGLILSPPTDRSYYNCNANNGVNNPAFLFKAGKYILYFKSNDTRNKEHWAPKMGLAVSDKLEGPYIQNKEPITKNEQVIEDGYAFEYNGKVYLVTTDNHGTIEPGGGLIWESEDGIHFNPEPKKAFSVLKNFLGGKIPATAVRTKGVVGDKFERPQVLMVEGKPAYIYMPSGTNVEGGKGSPGYVLKINID
jgi:hypothetical protein